MNPALRTTLHTFGFAIGFWMLLGGGGSAAAVLLSVVHGDRPSAGLLTEAIICLGLPLLAFRAYDRSRQAETESSRG